MSVDYGNKKLGIALSTPDHLICLPHKLILAADNREKIRQLLTIIKDENVCAIVIGLPVNMDSSISDQTTITLNFAKELSLVTTLPIFMQDERLTSRLAGNLLKTFGLNRKQRDAQDDLTSASLILETTLESVRRLSV